MAAGALVTSPVQAANLQITNGQTYTVTTNPEVVNSLNIDAGGDLELGSNTLFVTDNGVNSIWSGTINGVINVGTLMKTGDGTVTFSGLTATNDEIHIDGGTAVQSGTTNNIRYLTVGSDAGSGTFDISGGTLNISGTNVPVFPAFQVGDFGGIGVVNQTGGAVVLTTAAMNIGSQGGNGTYNLSGGTVTMTGGSSSTISIGRNTSPTRTSTGLLNISGGTFDVEAGNLVIGNAYSGAQATATQGTIDQTGGVLKIGSAAELDLAGYNKGTYNLDGGTLQIGGSSLHTNYNASTGSANFNLGGGTIQVIGSQLVTSVNANLVGGTTSTIDTNSLGATWNGILSGSGSLEKTGAGTLTLNGANTYSGATTVGQGTVALGAGGQLSNSSGVDLAGAGATLDITSGSKTIMDLSGVAGTIVTLGASTLTAGTTDDTTFAGVIGGSGGFTKQGGGALTLDAQNTYTGATLISNGTLLMGVADAIKPTSSVTVANNARWDLGTAGTQDVTGSVTVNGGIVMLNLGAGDKIVATGAATSSGGKVDVSGGNGAFDPNVDYVFLDGSSVSGSFSVVGNDMPLLSVSAVTDIANSEFKLHFDKSGQSIAFLADTSNEAAVGAALDPLLLSNSLYAQLATLNKDDLLAAIDSMEGDIHASTKSVLTEAATYIANATEDHIRDALGGAGGAGADMAPMASAARPGGPGLWISGYGHSLNLDDPSGNAADVSSTNGGLVAGLDFGSDGWIAGIGAGYDKASLSADSHMSSADVDGYTALAYAATKAGLINLSVGGSWTGNAISSTRTVVLPTTQTLTASYNGSTTQAFGEVGIGMGGFEPFAGANYIGVATDAFGETGGSAAITAAASNESVTFTTLGVRAKLAAANGLWLSGMAGWRHAFGDVTPVMNGTIQAQAFAVDGAPIATDAFVAEAGIDAALGPNGSIGVSYLGQMGANAQDHGAKATATLNF